jgi:hypothetical protein
LVLLQQELCGLYQNDMSIHEYATRPKLLADELLKVGSPATHTSLLTNMMCGLNCEFGQAASNPTLFTELTFAHALTYMPLEDGRM